MKAHIVTISILYLLASSCLVIEETPVKNLSDCESTQLPDQTHVRAMQLNSILDSLVNDGLVGGVVLIKSELNGDFYNAFGLADINSQTKTMPCQKYRIASLTKVLVATTTLILIDEGHFGLKTIIGKYLDHDQISGIEGIDEITIEQLLNHTSGIPNYDDDIRFAPMILNNPSRPITLEQKLNLVRTSGGRVPQWVIKKFGQIYSNSNYLLLQLVIEKATGKPYEEVVKNRIIAPLQLDATSFGSDNPYPNNLATGYVDFYGNGTIRNVNEWDANRFDAEGDIISNVFDLIKFYESLQKGELLSENMLDEMKTKRLGLLQEEFELENAIGHDGIAIGYSAEMWYLNESKLTIVLLSNQGRLVNENWSVLKFENLLRKLIEVAK